ncbi:C-GCAxxG-C-C family protein [Nitratidesulfovibrio liaohensis]|uniref:C-GCAxxG-C-C family protein n=1 Tax=Nitratidesulfovibrio liaohensis TaxID=2604158 RepID=A0ABY9R826_9BACT|nr:C-GCAxxG-C-C family protein [Nitratidesulfovibrio liaohensis]WMW66824.1 C-GCAxxG-C-C family protein [Nitratidesulfovibrio liaohensis]
MKTAISPNSDADGASRISCPDVCDLACGSADGGCSDALCGDGTPGGCAESDDAAPAVLAPADSVPADSVLSDPVVEAIRRRAENLFDTRQLLCAEAVLHAVAETLGGPLSPDQAAALGTPFCQGMGGAGCTCGALSGAVAAVGLFRGRPERGAGGTKARALARRMHDAFRASCGATCCRVLIRHVRHDKDAHFAQCRSLTGKGAVLAARELLAEGVRPRDGALPLPSDTGLTLWRNRLRALLRLPFRRRG